MCFVNGVVYSYAQGCQASLHRYYLLAAALCYSYYYLCFMGKKMKCRRKFVKLVGVIDLTPKTPLPLFWFLRHDYKSRNDKRKHRQTGLLEKC